MKQNKENPAERIYDAMTGISDDLIEEAAEEPIMRKSGKKRAFAKWIAAAVVLFAAVPVIVLMSRNVPAARAEGFVAAQAVYPDKDSSGGAAVMPDGMADFLAAAIPAFLSNDGGAKRENRICSPLNIYVALSMLAECTGGESREQILHVLGGNEMEKQREWTRTLWESQYFRNEYGTCTLADSMWMNEEISYVPETVDILAREYFASSFCGEMGDPAYDAAFAGWLNEETGGLLEETARDIRFNAQDVLVLASTLYFKGLWSSPFRAEETEMGFFHGTEGDTEVPFMHQTLIGLYQWRERFGFVSLDFTNGRDMLLILPDEGVDPEELLHDADFLALISGNEKKASVMEPENGENRKRVKIHLSLLRFDVSSETDLVPALRAFGVSDVLDEAQADFSPLVGKNAGFPVFLSELTHDVRVTVDEAGCTAAALTLGRVYGAAMPPEDEMDFTLDRPFLFAVMRQDLPLFVGIVNQP